MSYQPYMKVHSIRPATVCGVSSRMRLDVAVNLLTFQALKNKKITVLGGKQISLIYISKIFVMFIDIF